MGQIKMNGMLFRAYHGCYAEEQIKGSDFQVDIIIETDMTQASKSDNLSDALNYAEVYDIIKQEMLINSCLLEHVCGRILDQLYKRFQQIEFAEVCISKLNPPVSGQILSISVCQQSTYREHRTNNKR